MSLLVLMVEFVLTGDRPGLAAPLSSILARRLVLEALELTPAVTFVD